MSDFQFERRKVSTLFPPNVSAKWSEKVLDEGFVPFPKRLLRCLHKIFNGAHATEDLAAVLAIVDYLRPNLTRGPSIDFLAFTAGLPRDVFVERVNELEKRKLLQRQGPDEAVKFDLAGLREAIEKNTRE